MYQNAAVLAAFLLIYSAVARRVAQSWLSGPIVFAAAGVILGPQGLGVLDLDIGSEGLRLLSEGALAMVLFTDAASPFSMPKHTLDFVCCSGGSARSR